jgi:hypothetical protein
MGILEALRSVMENGLIPNDNGEIGSAIWFSTDYNDYGEKGSFVVSIEYNTVNRMKFVMTLNGNSGFAYKTIPFNELTVVKIPVGIWDRDKRVINSKKFIDSSERIFSIKNMNNVPTGITLYRNLFNEYVQPYINEKDFLNKINNPNVKIIDF